jgi:hypothetical protein
MIVASGEGKLAPKTFFLVPHNGLSNTIDRINLMSTDTIRRNKMT